MLSGRGRNEAREWRMRWVASVGTRAASGSGSPTRRRLETEAEVPRRAYLLEQRVGSAETAG